MDARAAPDLIKIHTLLTQAGARARRAPAAAGRGVEAPVGRGEATGAAPGAVEQHSRPSPLPHPRTPRAASPRTWYLPGSPAVEVQTDTRRAAAPGAAAASSWAAAARAAAWVWSVRPIRASSPRPELVYCALRVAIALLHRHLTQKGRGWARLRVRQLNSRDTRGGARSLSDVLGRLSSSETSVLTYSHFWY